MPLIGGSGGHGREGILKGGSGGGAILIATRGRMIVNGAIHARGSQVENAYGGSGGAIRIVTETLEGRGLIDARGVRGGDGRTRLEALNYTGGLTVYPPTLRVPPDSPPTIFPDNLPTARVVSVAGQNAPADPRSNLTETGTDVVMQSDQPVEIQIETTNLDPSASVSAHIIPRYGTIDPEFRIRYEVRAVHVSGDASLSRWSASTKLPRGFAAIQVRAVGQ